MLVLILNKARRPNSNRLANRESGSFRVSAEGNSGPCRDTGPGGQRGARESIVCGSRRFISDILKLKKWIRKIIDNNHSNIRYGSKNGIEFVHLKKRQHGKIEMPMQADHGYIFKNALKLKLIPAMLQNGGVIAGQTALIFL